MAFLLPYHWPSPAVGPLPSRDPRFVVASLKTACRLLRPLLLPRCLGRPPVARVASDDAPG
eukprot:507809-Heterocapsa_arctica.AAC.1